MESSINEELLGLINSIEIQSLNREPIPVEDLHKINHNQEVIMILRCTPSEKYKLNDMHFAITTVEETLLYTELGIPEFKSNEEE